MNYNQGKGLFVTFASIFGFVGVILVIYSLFILYLDKEILHFILVLLIGIVVAQISGMLLFEGIKLIQNKT